MVVLILLLLLAAALGILGAVIKVTLVIVLSFILAVILLGVIGYYYARHRFRRFVKDNQQQPGVPGGSERGYPTTGSKGPPPQLPE
jgi:Kef-type K+ transport system membrane component KefB